MVIFFFESLNLNINELWHRKKIQFGLLETTCSYHFPGRYHDQIRIITRLDDLQEKTVVLTHEIVRSTDDRVMVKGVEKRICMDVSDPEKIRAVAIPEDVYDQLKKA